MQRGRAYREARRLGERYPVAYSESDRRLVIQQFRFPEGWEPTFGRIRYDLPGEYPRRMPTVYISTDMEYTAGRTAHFLRNIHPSSDETGWGKWCIENGNVTWEPGEDTLVKLTQLVHASLAHPRADNPLENLE